MSDDVEGLGEGEEKQPEKEPQKGYRTILDQEIESGATELARPAHGLLLSGLSAGLDVSFSVLLMAIMLSLTGGRLSEPVSEILVANMYTIGFVFVILGRSELFTEHTTLAVFPVLAGKASVARLLRLWGLVYVANLAGAAAFAALTALVGPALGLFEPSILGRIAAQVVDHPGWVLVVSAVLAGWLMGLLSWLVTASRDTVGQILLVWLVTFAIGFAHLNHAVIGTTEVLAGVFSGQGATLADFFRFLGLTTLGNILGGTFFVAVIKYGHATRGA